MIEEYTVAIPNKKEQDLVIKRVKTPNATWYRIVESAIKKYRNKNLKKKDRRAKWRTDQHIKVTIGW